MSIIHGFFLSDEFGGFSAFFRFSFTGQVAIISMIA
jgi:hypothetical protein